MKRKRKAEEIQTFTFATACKKFEEGAESNKLEFTLKNLAGLIHMIAKDLKETKEEIKAVRENTKEEIILIKEQNEILLEENKLVKTTINKMLREQKKKKERRD